MKLTSYLFLGFWVLMLGLTLVKAAKEVSYETRSDNYSIRHFSDNMALYDFGTK